MQLENQDQSSSKKNASKHSSEKRSETERPNKPELQEGLAIDVEQLIMSEKPELRLAERNSPDQEMLRMIGQSPDQNQGAGFSSMDQNQEVSITDAINSDIKKLSGKSSVRLEIPNNSTKSNSKSKRSKSSESQDSNAMAQEVHNQKTVSQYTAESPDDSVRGTNDDSDLQYSDLTSKTANLEVGLTALEFTIQKNEALDEEFILKKPVEV